MQPGIAGRHAARRRAAAASLAWMAVAAIGCDAPSAAHVPRLRADGGDGQVAPIGTWLPKPLVVLAVDGNGAPAAGVQVNWHLQGNGRLLPLDEATDADGRARAAWLLDETEGAHTAEAVLPGFDPAKFTATGTAEPGELPFDEIRGLDFATYEGSRQVVHPDYAFTPNDLFGPRHHLAITPYPFGNARYENPSLFDGGRPDMWALSPGTPNPIVLPEQGYLSDPDLVYVPEHDELWLYYRQVTTDNIIHLVRTRDGRQWTSPAEVVRAPNHQIVSPSVVRRGADDWWMFSVNAGASGCGGPSTVVEVRRSSDGIHWSAPAPADLTQPNLWVWHIDVQWIPSRNVFWAVYNVKTGGGCTTPAVYMASSDDGMAWQVVSTPVLAKGGYPAFQDIVYRSTFSYDPADDALTFWYSGARYENSRYVWSAAIERRRRTDIFERRTALMRPESFTPAPAPLTDWP